MKKIYAHPNLLGLFDNECYSVGNINDIPYGCDLAAFSIFNYSDFEQTVAQLLSKSKLVLVDFNELTDLTMFKKANRLLSRHNNLQIISTVISNVPSRIEFSGQWFMSPINFYSNNSLSDWAVDFLSKTNTKEYSNRAYLFDCLLGKERHNRNFIEELYLKSTGKEKIFFSYCKDNIKNGTWDFPVDSVTETGQLIEHNNTLFTASSALPYSIYNQSFYSIVAETLIYNEYSFYTEKIVKPMLAKRPFIVFAGPYYLKNLKKLGFKTFDGIIDESYDSIVDYQQRFKSAWEQVEKIMLCDPTEIYQKTQHIREHNYQLFRSTDWASTSKQIIKNLIQ